MNLLDKINITPKAYKAYSEYAQEVVEALKDSGIKPSDIPDEQAIVLADGKLKVFVQIGFRQISFVLEAEDWEYM